MVRGYRRRHAEAWRRTRLLGAILLNVNRGKDEPAIVPEEWMALYGDPAPEEPETISEEEFARLMALD
jgi:hypothetical protein